MFLTMNRFKVKRGREEAFEDIWKNRDSHLHTVPGFKAFELMRGATFDDYTLYASHATWESRAAFVAWTKSEAFRKAHAGAGGHRDIYVGPPELETFTAV
ncbi:MAG: antibiotic biosynthesis monooxygenase family protein [Qingshengfaniella sp.]